MSLCDKPQLSDLCILSRAHCIYTVGLDASRVFAPAWSGRPCVCHMPLHHTSARMHALRGVRGLTSCKMPGLDRRLRPSAETSHPWGGGAAAAQGAGAAGALRCALHGLATWPLCLSPNACMRLFLSNALPTACRFSPYGQSKCTVCKSPLHQGGMFCTACAYSKGGVCLNMPTKAERTTASTRHACARLLNLCMLWRQVARIAYIPPREGREGISASVPPMCRFASCQHAKPVLRWLSTALPAGVCHLCGKQIIDTTSYKQTNR